jgi:hypothetical protein
MQRVRTHSAHSSRAPLMHWSELCKVKTQIMVCNARRRAFMARSPFIPQQRRQWIGCAHTHTLCLPCDTRRRHTKWDVVCVCMNLRLSARAFMGLWSHCGCAPRVWLLLFRTWMPIGRRRRRVSARGTIIESLKAPTGANKPSLKHPNQKVDRNRDTLLLCRIKVPLTITITFLYTKMR